MSVPCDPAVTVVVGNVLSKLSTDDVELYFESKKHSGGGPIANISVRRKENAALIVFEEAEAVNRILQKGSHTIDDTKVVVRRWWPPAPPKPPTPPPKPPTPPPPPPTAIKVTGYKSTTRPDVLDMYFSNVRKSDGGTVGNVDMYDDYAVVTFESDEVCAQVLRKGDHTLSSHFLTVEPYYPNQSSEAAMGDIEEESKGDDLRDQQDLGSGDQLHERKPEKRKDQHQERSDQHQWRDDQQQYPEETGKTESKPHGPLGSVPVYPKNFPDLNLTESNMPQVHRRKTGTSGQRTSMDSPSSPRSPPSALQFSHSPSPPSSPSNASASTAMCKVELSRVPVWMDDKVLKKKIETMKKIPLRDVMIDTDDEIAIVTCNTPFDAEVLCAGDKLELAENIVVSVRWLKDDDSFMTPEEASGGYMSTQAFGPGSSMPEYKEDTVTKKKSSTQRRVMNEEGTEADAAFNPVVHDPVTALNHPEFGINSSSWNTFKSEPSEDDTEALVKEASAKEEEAAGKEAAVTEAAIKEAAITEASVIEASVKEEPLDDDVHYAVQTWHVNTSVHKASNPDNKEGAPSATSSIPQIHNIQGATSATVQGKRKQHVGKRTKQDNAPHTIAGSKISMEKGVGDHCVDTIDGTPSKHTNPSSSHSTPAKRPPSSTSSCSAKTKRPHIDNGESHTTTHEGNNTRSLVHLDKGSHFTPTNQTQVYSGKSHTMPKGNHIRSLGNSSTNSRSTTAQGAHTGKGKSQTPPKGNHIQSPVYSSTDSRSTSAKRPHAETGKNHITSEENEGIKDKQLKDTGMKDKQVMDTGMQDKQVKDTGVRDKQVKDTDMRDEQVNNTGVKEKQSKMIRRNDEQLNKKQNHTQKKKKKHTQNTGIQDRNTESPVYGAGGWQISKGSAKRRNTAKKRANNKDIKEKNSNSSSMKYVISKESTAKEGISKNSIMATDSIDSSSDSDTFNKNRENQSREKESKDEDTGDKVSQDLLPQENVMKDGMKDKTTEESSLETVASKKSYHENSCAACRKPGKLILCEKTGCKYAFHLRCVGLSVEPEGEWICNMCTVSCLLCKRPKTKTCGDLWLDWITKTAAHSKCMRFASNLYLEQDADYNRFEGYKVESVIKEMKRAEKLTCHLCKEKGAASGCALPLKSCRRTYHYYCAKKSKQIITKKTEEVVGSKILWRFEVFCREDHFEQYKSDMRKEKRNMTYSDDTANEDEELETQQPSDQEIEEPEPSDLEIEEPEPSDLEIEEPEPSDQEIEEPEPSDLEIEEPEPSDLEFEEHANNPMDVSENEGEEEIYDGYLGESEDQEEETDDPGMSGEDDTAAGSEGDCVLCFCTGGSRNNSEEMKELIQQIALDLYHLPHRRIYLMQDSATFTSNDILYLIKDISQALRTEDLHKLGHLIFELSHEDRREKYGSLVSFQASMAKELQESVTHHAVNEIRSFLAEANPKYKKDVGHLEFNESLDGPVLFLRVCQEIDPCGRLRSQLGLFTWDDRTMLCNVSRQSQDTVNDDYHVFKKWMEQNVQRPEYVERWPKMPHDLPCFPVSSNQSVTESLAKLYLDPEEDGGSSTRRGGDEGVRLMFLGPVDTDLICFNVFAQRMISSFLQDYQQYQEQQSHPNRIYCVLDIGGETGILQYSDIIPEELPSSVQVTVQSSKDPAHFPVAVAVVTITFME